MQIADADKSHFDISYGRAADFFAKSVSENFPDDLTVRVVAVFELNLKIKSFIFL